MSKRGYAKRSTVARSQGKVQKADYLLLKSIAHKEAKKAVAQEIETKMIDTNVTAQAIDYNNGYVVSLTNTMIRGTDDKQYLGDSIMPVGLKVRFQFTRSDASQLCRIILIQNKAGGIPLLSTLLASTGNLTAPLSPYDNNYQDTYRILKDKLYSMDSIRNLTTIGEITLNSKQLNKIYFNDAVGTVEKGGIYMCVISDSSISVHPTFDYRARLYYKDA